MDFLMNVKHQMLSSTSSSSLSSVGSFFDGDESSNGDDKVVKNVDEVNKELHGELADGSIDPQANNSSSSEEPKVKQEDIEYDSLKSSSSENENDEPTSLSKNELSDEEEKVGTKEEKLVKKPTRPKTAKLPRNKDLQNTSVPETQEIEATKIQNLKSSSSSSTWSATSSEKNIDTKDRKSLNDLEQRMRERFLHRCLDQHLSSQLDRQRAYFDRSTAPRRNQRKVKRVRRAPPSVSRNQTGRQNPEMILPAFSPVIREKDIQRNIKRLISELARNESLRSLMGPLNNKSRNQVKAKNSTFQRSDSYSSYTSTSSSSKQLSDKVFADLAETTSTFSDCSNKKSNEKVNKSILKNPKQKKRQEKRVKLMEERNEERYFSKKNQRKARREAARVHLTALLNENEIGPADYIMSDNFGQLHRVTLRHTPINPMTSSDRNHQVGAKQRRKKPTKNDAKKFKSTEENVKEKKNELNKTKPPRPTSAKNASNDANTIPKDEQKMTPRIRPGSEPIKCNWNPEKSQPKTPELKFSDHQLKNSSNAAVLEWLSRKNAIARSTRIHKFRENRSKRDRLMLEQNEKEDKQANALVEYEKWKKKKNREILLRRRREALQTNANAPKTNLSATVDQKSAALKPSKTFDSSITAFSDLRSSAISPHPPSDRPPALSSGETRRRPKSAPTKVHPGNFGTQKNVQNFVPVRIDFENGDVTILSARDSNNLASASERDSSARVKNGEKKTNFMKDLIDDYPPAVSNFDISIPSINQNSSPNSEASPEKMRNTSKNNALDKDHYNDWVRSKGLSSPYQVKINKPKKASKSQLPPHDPLTNEIISDLAKRRIKKILNRKKRVDTGISQNRDPPPTKVASRTSDEVKKWRLKEDARDEGNLKSASKKDSKKTPDNKRPTFTFNKKTKSKSIYHERNPVVNQALNS